MVSTGVLTVIYCVVLWYNIFVKRILEVDHNLESLEFEDPLD